MSSELYENLEKLVLKAPEARHSYFQLKYFVLGKEPTHQGRLWKCLRELSCKKESLDSLTFQMEDAKDNLELLKIQREKDVIFGSYNQEEEIIKERQFNRQQTIMTKSIDKMESQIKFLWQEIKFFIQAYEDLSKFEPMKDYDDINAQKEFWNEKISEDINLRILLQQPFDIELAKTALSLNEDSSVRIYLEQRLEEIQAKLKTQIKEIDGETKDIEHR